jgi:hypothetical protein
MSKPLDDLIRDTLRARAAGRSAACLDADRAASFVDLTMSARERAEAEAHLADCPRCQALLGALVRTAPPPPERAWWRRPAMVWLAPLTVAATAVAIWINVPDTPRVVAPAPVARQEVAAPPSTQPEWPRETGEARFAIQPAREASAPSAKTSAPPAAAGEPVGGLDAPAVSSAGASPPPPKAPAAPAPAPLPPQPAAADAGAPRAELRADGRLALAETRAVATPVRSRAAPTMIVSANRTSQWRLAAGGELQHSVDGGVTWQMQTTGSPATPIGGFSPSSSVCWLVGPNGLVLVTTDQGQSWRRVPFPLAIDLAAVRATDHQIAAVTTADGRTFQTSDGGQTWRQ